VPGLFDQTPQDVAAHKSQFAVWSLGFSLFERAWSLRGLEGFMMDLVDSPAFAEELLDRICEVNCDLIKQACQQPIDGVRFGDDWGAQKGMMMGADHWRQFIKPRFARMVATARAGGKKTLLHSDGDIIEIIPDLIEVGLDVLNPVQPDVMDIYEIKRRFGKNLTLFGGVSVQQFLPYAKPAEVRAEVRKLIRQLGAGGGLIIAPTHELGRDIPLENLLAMMEEFSRQHLSQ
jgi:uroporphyrinogen decarboxylase